MTLTKIATAMKRLCGNIYLFTILTMNTEVEYVLCGKGKKIKSSMTTHSSLCLTHPKEGGGLPTTQQ